MGSSLQRWLIGLSLLTSVAMLAVMAGGRTGLLILVVILLFLLVFAAVLEYVYLIAPKTWYRWYRGFRKPGMALFCLIRGVPVLPPLPKEAGPEPILTSQTEFSQMAQVLRGEVCGQDRAVALLVHRLETAVELRATSGGRPLGVYLFVGGEGIGKRYLGALANHLLFRGQGGWLETDLNDGQEGSGALVRLLGSPQSPSGLVSALRTNPYGTVVLENVDAAGEAARKALGRLLRSGSYVDPHAGGAVSFQNCVFVLTTGRCWESLLAARDKLRPDETTDPGVIDEWARGSHQKLAEEANLDELLLSRIHEVVCFDPPSDMVKLGVIEQLMKRECARHEIELEWADPRLVAEQIASVSPAHGFAPAVGHVERLLRDEIKRARAQGRRRLRMTVGEPTR